MHKILIVDDEKKIRFTFSEFLKNSGFFPIEAQNSKEAVEQFIKEKPHAALIDIMMPGVDGISCMKELKKIDPQIPCIVITAHGDVPTAVKAIKSGAYDFILKPPDFEKLIITINHAIEKLLLERTVKRLNEEIETSTEWLLGKSKSMKGIIDQIRQISSTDFSVIIEGETGTGKSFIARTIHDFSKRSDGLFMSIDMGTIPENLAESELFGHEKGAFTGAERKKKGYFESSHKGTIFIDELQNMSLYLQGKLLRVVDEKKLYPLGSTKSVEVDARIISATNQNIHKAVSDGRIKEDLFYRLGEVVISLPPLRERVEDIPFFAQKFFRETTEELNKNIAAISEEALMLLKQHSWPGNIRELKNVMKRTVLFCKDDIIRPEHINYLSNNENKEKTGTDEVLPLKALMEKTIRDVEKEGIKKALKVAEGNKTKAAKLLQISYQGLLSKIKEYEIK